MKKNLQFAICLVLAVALWQVMGCSDRLSRAYYARHPMSSEDVAKVWGDPVAVHQLPNNVEKRIYPIQNAVTDLKYRYFLIQGGRVLASGLTDSAAGAEQDQRNFEQGFTPSDISKTYYEKHPMPVDELDRIWGRPIAVDKATDGAERRVYEISDPFTDFRYRYFLVRDGLVVASRISPDKGFQKDDGRRTAQNIQVNDISHAFYERHPMTLAEVETTWGQPALVISGDGGLEERIYKIANPYPSGFEFRYFIVKGGQVVSSGITDTLDLGK